MVKLVTLDEDHMPEPFSSVARKKAAKAKALQKLGVKFAKEGGWVCFLAYPLSILVLI